MNRIQIPEKKKIPVHILLNGYPLKGSEYPLSRISASLDLVDFGNL